LVAFYIKDLEEFSDIQFVNQLHAKTLIISIN